MKGQQSLEGLHADDRGDFFTFKPSGEEQYFILLPQPVANRRPPDRIQRAVHDLFSRYGIHPERLQDIDDPQELMVGFGLPAWKNERWIRVIPRLDE